ncbi:hypothetical protein R3P38DRAFT_3295472 [Favolaschia claudopus]|uniref:DUF6535 domain-containing protein n=1 Tax=Favolaschia claudopus TaxID=2862362 RepID=A0AAV9ZCC4_9AGAR
MDEESHKINRRDTTSNGDHNDGVGTIPSPAYISPAIDKEAQGLEAEAISERNHDDEAGAKIWSVYISEADKYDKALVESWKSDMNGMLIFAGLFSAILSAFLIKSYKSLTPDSEDRMATLLGQISIQLSGIANGTRIDIPFPEPFVVSTSSLVCNLLWFISLGLSLSSALIATLVEQWARDFRYKTDMRSSPVIRARIFAYLYYGLKRFNMHAVVDLIPFLLHASLVLFFVGLVAFLAPVNRDTMILSFILLGILLFVYAALTVFPYLYHDSPYKTPLSAGLWRIVQHFRTFDPAAKVSRPSSSMVDAMNETAICSSPHRDERDRSALSWTVKSLSNDVELEPFLEGIPDALHSSGPHGRRRAYDKQIEILVQDSNIQLLKRAESFLRDCDSSLLIPEMRTRRHTTALKALWAIAATLPTAGHLMMGSTAQFDWPLVRQSVSPEIGCFQVSTRAALYLNVVISFLSEIDVHLQVLTQIERGLLPSGVYPQQVLLDYRSLSEGLHFTANRLTIFISQSRKWQIAIEESLLQMAPNVEGLVANVNMNEIGHCPSVAELASNCHQTRSALQSLRDILIQIEHIVHVDFLSNAATQEARSYQFDATESLFTSRTSSYDKFEGSLFSQTFDQIATNKLVPDPKRTWPLAISKHADEVLGTLLLLIVMWGRGMDGAVMHVPQKLGWYLTQQPHFAQSAVLQKCNNWRLCHCLMVQIDRTVHNTLQIADGMWILACEMLVHSGYPDPNPELGGLWKIDSELSRYPQLLEQMLALAFCSLKLHPSLPQIHLVVALIQSYALNFMLPESLNLRNWKIEADTLVPLHPVFANLHSENADPPSMSILDLRMSILSNVLAILPNITSGVLGGRIIPLYETTLVMLTHFYPEAPGVSASVQFRFAETWNAMNRKIMDPTILKKLGWPMLSSKLFFAYRTQIASPGPATQFCWLNDTRAVQVILEGWDLWMKRDEDAFQILSRYKSVLETMLGNRVDAHKGDTDSDEATYQTAELVNK